nr:MAG TPA: hypothetical protein [Caudoviricetes sp.]
MQIDSLYRNQFPQWHSDPRSLDQFSFRLRSWFCKLSMRDLYL